MGRTDPGKQSLLRQRLKRSLDSISVKQKIVWAFAIIIFLTVVARGFVFQALWNYRDESKQLLRTYNQVRDAEELDERLSSAEGDIRGYVISGNKVFLNKIDEHYRIIDSAILHLKEFTRESPAYAGWAAKLDSAVKEEVQYGKLIIATYASIGKAAAEKRIIADEDLNRMTVIKDLIASFQHQEDKLLEKKGEDNAVLFVRIIQTNVVGTLFNILFLVVALFIIFRDLRKQKSLENKLRENELRLLQFFDALPIGITVIDKNGRVNFTNREGRKLTLGGANVDRLATYVEAIEDADVYIAGTEDKYPLDKLPITRALQGETVYTEDLEIRRGGRKIQFAVSSSPIYNLEGDVESAISGFMDITERKRAEAELIRANEIALQSSLAKERFLANMSHEIRTPLNAIIGFADLISRTPLDKEQSEHMEAIISASENLLAIVNDILDFSKIEAGMVQIEQVPFSVSALLDSIRILLGQKAKQKHLDFTIHTDTSVPDMVVGDPVRLTQILLNLGGNAIKFTEKGTVSVSAVASQDEAGNILLSIAVADTGIGISPENVDRIFERFNQENMDTTRKFGGTGLGLNIVKSLLEMQSGNITLESEVGRGSVFKIQIPYRLPTAREMEEFQEQLPAIAGNLTGLKVLLAEDNILNQRLVERILTDAGMKVDIAGTGKAAVEMLSAKEYDFVLMDMQMPVMDGYEAASIIRKEMKSDIPIIAMTAHAMQGEKEKCLRLGMNDYIPKPIRTKELFEKLSRLRGTEISSSDGQESDGTAPASIAPDFSYLMEATGGNSEFIVELLSMCMKSIPEDVDLLGKAVEDMDLAKVKYYAHKMRSSSTLTGVRQLTDSLKLMEQISIGEREPVGSLPQLMRETETLVAYALQVIETEIGKRNSVAG